MKYLTPSLIILFISLCCNAIHLENESQTTENIDSTKIVIRKKATQNTNKSLNHKAWTDLLEKHVSKAGNVNYKGFVTDKTKLVNYINSLSETLPNDTWSKNDKLAYWINAYNAMTVDLIVQNYPIKSIKDIKNPWEQSLWKLGNKWYNLEEIEHQILRKMDEPRIHFAIVCASKSCPKLLNEAYIPSKLDLQLTVATEEFLLDDTKNSISKNQIELSKIFKWFSEDFKHLPVGRQESGSLIDFLNQYSKIEISPNAKKSYKDYNWYLND